MTAYVLGTYMNGIPVYFSGLNSDNVPHFSDDVTEAEFGMLHEVKKAKETFERLAPQYGPYEIVQVNFEDDEDVD